MFKIKSLVRIAAALLCVTVLAAAGGCSGKKKDSPAPPRKTVTVTLSETELSLLAGEKKTITPTVKNAGSSGAGAWETSNPSVAAVDGNGVVTGVSPGSCTIRYTYAGKYSAALSLTVKPSSNKVTVLMYHSIVYQKGNPLRIPPGKFDDQMKWLSENGYTSLTPDEVYAHMASKTPFPEKSVMITLDDGYIDNYAGAFPILKKYNLHATIFMISGYIDKDAYLTSAALKEMSDSGLVSIECHTVTHPHLSKLSYDQQYKELKDSKETLESLLGKKVEYLAYPFGDYNQDTIRAAQSLGFKMCFKMSGGTGSLSSSLFEFPRAYIVEDLNSVIQAATGHGS